MMKKASLALTLAGVSLVVVSPFALASGAQKGVIYLPVVSLSSYLPIAGQILLMILIISLSGLFGAWLMFQRLAKKVLALESERPPTPVVEAQAPMACPSPAPAAEVPTAPERPLLLATVNAHDEALAHRRTIFVSKKSTAPKNSSRLVIGRPGCAKPKDASAARDDNRVVPQTFLLNDWFPLDRSN